MRILLVFLGSAVGLVLIVGVTGLMLPKSHHVSRQATLAAAAESLFDLISTPANFPSWRSEVERVELLPPADGITRYREVSRDGSILYAVVRAVPNRELVTEIADHSLPFGGRWTFTLTPVSAGATTVRITEDGEVYNPVFRFVSRFILGEHATIDRYLADLRKRIGGKTDMS